MYGLIRSIVFSAAALILLTPAAFAQPPDAGDLGTVSVRVQPVRADVVVMIDGERWVSPQTDGRLVVQLPEGRHAVEIRAPGYRTFSTIVDIRRSETTPLNVSLSAAPESAPAPQPPAPATGIRQIADGGENGFAIAPDYRITEVGHRTAQFAGVYGGRVFDRQLLIGAGGYWQVNPTNTLRMAYGGAVVEWRVWAERTISFTAHGLAGYGQARDDRIFVFEPRRGDQHVFGDLGNDIRDGRPRRWSDGFFVAEPEAQIVARFGSRVSLRAGVGYRVTSGREDLNGVSGSVSVVFGR